MVKEKQIIVETDKELFEKLILLASTVEVVEKVEKEKPTKKEGKNPKTKTK